MLETLFHNLRENEREGFFLWWARTVTLCEPYIEACFQIC
jgi:hypothetical protein